jgi:YesN/AraC family two-component response regulator
MERNSAQIIEYHKLLARLCEETIRESGRTFSSVSIHHMDLLVVIHMEEDPDSAARGRLLENLRMFVDSVYRTLRISVTVGVSSVFGNARDAHAALEEAREAVRQKLILGLRQVVEYAQVPPPANRYFYPTAQEKQVFAGIAAGNRNAALEGIHQLFAALKTRKGLTTENAMLAVHLFVATLVRQVGESDRLFSLSAPEGIQILGKVYFSSMDTLDEIENFLAERVAAMFDRDASDRPSETTLFDRMAEYIHQNYTRDIGIEHIASHLGISYSYTRRVFSENTGRNILDYVNEMRIRTAREHLAACEKTIGEIARLVGYNNEQSFTRFFKKYTHMLPSQYRKESAAEK